MGNEALAALAKELAPLMRKQQADTFGYGQKHDASGTPITVGYVHGPGGSLYFPGVDPAVFHTVVGNVGILGQLPTKGSQYTNPTYAIITGVQADYGSEGTGPCDDAPGAGLKKTCVITVPFGRYERATREVELNRVVQQVDRSDPMDLTLVGSPIHQTGLFSSGAQSPATPADLLKNEISQKFWERNISIHRLLSNQLWIGNPATAASGGGFQMAGFDRLITTGYADVSTYQRCPSVDSDLKDFNYARIDGAGNGTILVDTVTAMYHYVKRLAVTTGVMPVRWVFAMRSQLFYELTTVWPCSYLTYRCQTTTNQNVVVEATQQVEFRDAMRQGRYLLIDGEKVEVVLDDGIAEDTNTTNGNVTSGCFASDIYLIPMSVIGGRAVTYLEYLDYNAPAIQQALGNMILGRIEGAFITWPRQTNLCVVWQSKIEPRLVLRTPWLAGRLQNVMYCPLQHEREPFPEDPYFVDGGLTTRPGPSYYTLWNPPQPVR